MTSWWVVLVEAEYTELSDLFGPWKSKEAADAMAARWNSRPNRDGAAVVMPVQPPSEMAAEIKGMV